MKSCNARLSIQMLFRVRELADKEIVISLNKLTPPTDVPTDKEINDLVREKKIVSNCNNINSLIFDDEILEKCNIYRKLKRENLKENYLSSCDLGQEILRILTAHHKIKLDFNKISCGDFEDMIEPSGERPKKKHWNRERA